MMDDYILIIRKRTLFYIVNVVLCFVFVLYYLGNNLMPLVIEYGKHKCNNVVASIVNVVVEEQVSQRIKDNIVYQKDMIINYNTSVLNSITSNVIKKSQQILYQLEKGMLSAEFLNSIDANVSSENVKRGIIYEIPISTAVDNPLIGNLGISIPIKYKLAGDLRGEITSTIKEYGINNALLEINLIIKFKSRIMIPILSEEEETNISVPLVVQLVQGDIPSYLYGTHVIGGSDE